jgi:hypothetical protein
MALSKPGLKALGLFALVLGLMAFATGSAQAEVGAHWNVAGKSINGTGLKPELQAKELENKTSTLLTKILGSLYHVLCTGITLIGFVLLDNGGSSGTIRFTNCVAIVNGVVQKACEPKSKEVAGVIETNLLKDLIVLHKLENGEVDTLDRLEPNEGETFATIESSASCAVGAKIPVKGKFFLKDCKNEFQTELVDHLVEEGPLTHLFVISDTVEHAGKIDGSVILTLAGAHAGLTWSGTPA